MKILAVIVIVSFVHLVSLIYGNVAHQESKAQKPLLDGVNIEKLSGRQLQKFLEAEDEKLIGDIDIWAGKQALKKLRRQRRKRIPPVVVAGLWTAGRYILRSVIRHTIPKITKHYKNKQLKKITKQYFKRGNYNKVLKDFDRFRPTNVEPITEGGRVVGRTGQILDGKVTITARRFSTYPTKPGRPTLEIYKKTKDGVKVYRKLRYESRKSYRKNKVNYKYRKSVKKIKKYRSHRTRRSYHRYNRHGVRRPRRRLYRSRRRGGRRSLRSKRRGGGRRSLRSKRRGGGRRSLRSKRRGGRRSLRSKRRGGGRSRRSRRRGGRRSLRSKRRGGRRSLRSRRLEGRRSLRSRRRGGRRSYRSRGNRRRRSYTSRRRGGRRSHRSRRGGGRGSYGSRGRGGRRSIRRSGRSRLSGRWG